MLAIKASKKSYHEKTKNSKKEKKNTAKINKPAERGKARKKANQKRKFQGIMAAKKKKNIKKKDYSPFHQKIEKEKYRQKSQQKGQQKQKNSAKIQQKSKM